MRKLIVLLALALFLAACGDDTTEPDPAAVETEAAPEEETSACDSPPLYEDGVLTVATDRPAYPPWFEGDPEDYTGFEGDLAKEISVRLGVPIKWVVEPFNKSYAPGAKEYDFDINQISITPERDQVVDFSNGYFNSNQALLSKKDNPIGEATSLSDLQDFTLGAQVGTTSLAFINETVQPNETPKVFDTTNDAKSALDSGQIDALVTDVVTTVYLRDFEFKGTEVVGQYPTDESFGMLFEDGNELQRCVNELLAEMEEDGTLGDLQEQWLQDYLSVPTLSG